jgi:hypothetical protein
MKRAEGFQIEGRIGDHEKRGLESSDDKAYLLCEETREGELRNAYYRFNRREGAQGAVESERHVLATFPRDGKVGKLTTEVDLSRDRLEGQRG